MKAWNRSPCRVVLGDPVGLEASDGGRDLLAGGEVEQLNPYGQSIVIEVYEDSSGHLDRSRDCPIGEREVGRSQLPVHAK